MLERRAQRAAAGSAVRTAPYPQANSQPAAAGPDLGRPPVVRQPPRLVNMPPNNHAPGAPMPPPPNGGPQNAPPPNGPPPIELRPLPGPPNGPQQNQHPMMRYNPQPPFFVQYNGNMNGMPQNMGPPPGMPPMAPMPPPHLQRGGPNGLDGVIGWMMQDAPPPLQANPPPANNGEDDVIVLDDDSTEERSDLSVLSSAVSLIVPPAFAFANMNDRIVSPAKFVSKLQQFFTVSLRPVHPDSFVVSVQRISMEIVPPLKLQLRVWGVNERQEEQFRYVCLRDINDLGHVYLGRRMDCCQLNKIFCHLDVASNQNEIAPTDRLDRSRVLDIQAAAFDREEFSDLTVHAKDRVFHVSKAFLCAHSDVFAGMLTHDMREKKEAAIHFKDLEGETVEKMLRYMYTGEVRNLRECASELFTVADRYGLVHLQDVCLNVLYERMDIPNILDCLELSFAFERLETFRERTLGFVVANLREVRQLSGWKQFSNDHPEISTEILDRIKL